MQNDKHNEPPSSSPEDEKELNRERRGIGAIFSSVPPGLITLAVESLTSWIKGKQQNRIHQAVDKMRKTVRCKQYSDSISRRFLYVWKI